MQNIDTIIFDLGAVLISWDPYPVLLKSFNYNEEKTRWFLENICNHGWNNSLDAGKSFAQARKEKTAEYPQYKQYIEDYLDKWEDMLLGEIPETVEILKSLKESANYRLLAITNWNNEKFPIARRRYPFLSWFEDIVVSGEVKMVKPNRDIYEYAIKRFKLDDPTRSVFIDDRLENILAAEELRIKGIHFQNAPQLKSELIKLGVAV
jgi:2-haloacid dehalogenase